MQQRREQPACIVTEDLFIADEAGVAILDQLVEVLQSGLAMIGQMASFCRLRSYISMQSLAMGLSTAHGNVVTCLHGVCCQHAF